MAATITYSFAREEMEVLKFLLTSLMLVQLEEMKDRRLKFFLQEMLDQGSTSDEEVRCALLSRRQEIAERMYAREFCG